MNVKDNLWTIHLVTFMPVPVSGKMTLLRAEGHHLYSQNHQNMTSYDHTWLYNEIQPVVSQTVRDLEYFDPSIRNVLNSSAVRGSLSKAHLTFRSVEHLW